MINCSSVDLPIVRAIRVSAFFLMLLAAMISGNSHVFGQQVWEFAPYRVQVWIAFDASLQSDDESQVRLLGSINNQLHAAFRAAWSVDTRLAPHHLDSLYARGLHTAGLPELVSNEIELVLHKDSEETDAIRTFEAALERLDAIAISTRELTKLTEAKKNWRTDAKTQELVEKLCSKCVADKGTDNELAIGLENKSISAAIIPRAISRKLEKSTRSVFLPLPWQTEFLYREVDKTFFVAVRETIDGLIVDARELDCPMRLLGPVISRSTSDPAFLSYCVRDAIVGAFAPVARAEQFETRTAKLRLRAGGLIMDQANPAFLHPGDVLQPVIRRDDRNGVPSLLEPLPWTFAVVTRTDGIKLDANVYSGIRGALQGQRNNRTQRILMRVRPTADATNIKVVVKGNNELPQSGCTVFARDLASEDLKSIGRTDWRGMINVASHHASNRIIPDQIAQARAKDAAATGSSPPDSQIDNKSQSSADTSGAGASNATQSTPTKESNGGQKTSAKNAEQTDELATGDADSASEQGPASVSKPAVQPAEQPFQPAIELRQPLALLYVKSGDNVLARLPLVLGLTKLEVAELPSDTRRLEAEAFVKGFQGEVLELIGMRNMLAARSRKLFADKKLDEARAAISQIRALRSYTEMADALETLQRKMLDETNDPIPLASKNRIDRMFQVTRESLQKYLQEDIARKLEVQFEQAATQSASVPQP